MSYRFDTGDLFARNTCLLSSNDIRDVNYDRDRDWDLYELLDSTFCRGRESVEGKKWLLISHYLKYWWLFFKAICKLYLIDWCLFYYLLICIFKKTTLLISEINHLDYVSSNDFWCHFWKQLSHICCLQLPFSNLCCCYVLWSELDASSFPVQLTKLESDWLEKEKSWK